jgi:uncharacterized membrane protein
MLLLIVGLCLFTGVHLLREVKLRDLLLERWGRTPYLLAYSLISLLGIVFMVVGKSHTAFTQLWTPIYELRIVTHYLMLPATILVAAGNLPNSHLRQHLRHPMLLGTALWGASHLWANGDLASMLLFGTLTVWALVKLISLWSTPAPAQKPASLLWDLIAIVVGFTAYALIAIFHGQLFGIGLSFE